MHWRQAQRSAVFLAYSLVVCSCAVPAVDASTAQWPLNTEDTASISDSWFYTHATSPGMRALSPTFVNEFEVNANTHEFEPMSANTPARFATALFAFDTSTQITTGLPTGRYKINSVTMKATWTYDGDLRELKYQSQPVSQSQILSEHDPDTPATPIPKPIELYGAGLRAGYTGYEFGEGGTSGPPLLDESVHSYSAPDGGYIAYPIVRTVTQSGTFSDVDVMNSITGGYSDTEPSHTTSPFTPVPWSLGKAYHPSQNPNDPPIELTTGDVIDDNTTFTFNLDLDLPGVELYIQEGLSTGALGFFLSSAHSTGELGASGGGYPRWYNREAAGFPYSVPLGYVPQLVVDYEILPAGVAGDYNGNGVVDAADYVLWRNGGPLQNQVNDPEQVNQQDYIEWRARFGNIAGSGGGLGSASSVPEPSEIAFVLTAIPLLGWSIFGRIRT